MFYVAGVDVSFVKGDDVNACAALVVLSFPQLEVISSQYYTLCNCWYKLRNQSLSVIYLY